MFACLFDRLLGGLIVWWVDFATTPNGRGSTSIGPFRGRCTTHFSIFSGDWDVHWGYDSGFDPQPNALEADGTQHLFARLHASGRSHGAVDLDDMMAASSLMQGVNVPRGARSK